MAVKLKKLKDQVIIITGASSGIGLVTAQVAAKQGARLVLAARSEEALRQVTNEITQSGGEAVYVVADVGKQEDVRKIARVAKETFGGFDTWVNDAGVSIYGKLEDTPIEDMRHLFETNVWGVVYGSLEAARHLKQRGGTIINIGSTLSDRAIPLQGIYSASKHAVKGFTDSLRMELEGEGVPVSVTLIKPGAIATPYSDHAKNYMAMEPTLPPPVYAPETVARAILHCAQTPTRDLFVGAGGKMIAASGRYAPRLTDKIMQWALPAMQQKSQPARPGRREGLYEASGEGKTRGSYEGEGYVAKSSLYTQAMMHPVLTSAALVGAGLAIAALWRTTTHNGASRQPSDNASPLPVYAQGEPVGMEPPVSEPPMPSRSVYE